MVSVMIAAIAFSLGILVYIAIPFIVNTAPIEVRERVGTFHHKLAARCLKQWAFLRREKTGYDVKPIEENDEMGVLECTLDGSTLGDDTKYRFADPDDRIKRLYNKPVALCYEMLPAAVDAELSEIGHWVREKDTDEGLVAMTDGGNGRKVVDKVDPYVRVPCGLYLSDPKDAMQVTGRSVEPKNITTAIQKTKKRFEKYGDFRDAAIQMVSGLLGFLGGIGGVLMIKFFESKFLDSSAAGDVTTNVPLGMIVPEYAIEMLGVMA